MRQVPDSNIASTIQYDGSTWALFHFIHFSSIVIFIYYILLFLSRFLSLYIARPFLPVWASSTSAGRHFASTHNGAFLFVVRIRFRFVNEMELNEMYNLLCLGDFGSQCAMRKTKPKSHFRFLLLCNIYPTICKLIHTSMYEYISLGVSALLVRFIGILFEFYLFRIYPYILLDYRSQLAASSLH